MAKPLAGMAYFNVNGQSYQLAADAKYSTSVVTRETMKGMDGIHGYKEEVHAPYIKATLRDGGALTVASFNGMTGVNVTIELANGKTVTGSNMWTTDVQEVNTTDATFEVTFEGAQVTEITGG